MLAEQRVYLLEHIAGVVSNLDQPQDRAALSLGWENRLVNDFIEVHLWTDGPVSHLITLQK